MIAYINMFCCGMMNWILGRASELKLSPYRTIVYHLFISLRIKMASLQAEDSAIYSASVLLRATLRCFSDRQEIRPPARK